MKKILSIIAISISGAYAGDYNWETQQQQWAEFNRQQAEHQAEFDRRHYELEQDRIQRQNERRLEDLQDRIEFYCE